MVPCTDPRGCPNLIVDAHKLRQWHVERRTCEATDCAVMEGSTEAGQRLLLRFTASTPNLGPGDLIIGARDDHPEWFDEPICHKHSHFKEYADYRLWTPAGYEAWQALRQARPDALAAEVMAAHPELQQQVVVGRKLGYCVIDIESF